VRIAVTGAGGRLGGHVVQLLATRTDHHVVAVTRRDIAWPSDRVSGKLADYRDLPALRAALEEVHTLVFVSSDGDATKLLWHHENVVRAAVASGVANVVVLSSVDADIESPFCYAVTNGRTEQMVLESGRPFSVVRASIFTEFFLELLNPASANGQMRLPAGDGRVSLVSRADVGRCLAALAAGPPTGRCHDVTGPESLDLPALAELTAREWRAPVRYVDIPRGEYCTSMAVARVDPWWMYAFSTMFDSIREQRWDLVTDEVQRLTGRTPTSVEEVLAQVDARPDEIPPGTT
jgi:NAD(P)H dehydrogenase (quinone)